MLDIQLPALPGGAATLLRWLADEGATLEHGAPLALVLTEQAEVALPAPAAGTLARAAAEGARLEPGDLLGRLVQDETPQPEGQIPPRRATPLARSIARVHQLDLAGLAGSGPHGTIRAADVRVFLPSNPSTLSPSNPLALPPSSSPALLPSRPLALPPSEQLPIAGLTYELDASAALARLAVMHDSLARLKLEAGLTACVVEAVGAVLPAHPLLNARWSEEAIVLRRRIHVAVGQPCDGTLRWRLVADAGDLTLRGVARALAAPSDDVERQATFAVVGLERGAAWQMALPLLPNTAAALSCSAPVPQPAATGEGVAIRPVALLTLSYDARVVDQQEAACFLKAVRDRLLVE